MPSALPLGDPVPEDGALPESALAGVGTRPFGIYVHVPFCTARCGYCDFNTYTADEFGPAGGAPGAPGDVRRRRDRRATPGPGRAGRRRLPGEHGVLRRGYADPAEPGRPRRRAWRSIAASSAWRRGRGHDRGQPRQRRAVGPGPAARGRVQPDLVRHAVRGRPRAPGPGPHPRPPRLPDVVDWARQAGSSRSTWT